MADKNPKEGRNVQRQLAIFEVAKDARGKSMDEIKEMLRAAFSRHRVSGQPGTWLDGVASEASYGEPYIVDMPSALAADSIMPAPDPQVQQTLAGRRKLRQSEEPPAKSDRAFEAAAPSGGGTASAGARGIGTVTGRDPAVLIVAVAVALTLAVSAAVAFREARRRAARQRRVGGGRN